MGLDMFLFKKEKESVEFDEIGYWRKANQIHGWFVEKAQNGIDECQDTKIELEKLVELKKACYDVLEDKSKALKLLPPRPGFFFGGYELDEWYFEQIKETIKILDKAIDKVNEGAEIYYTSSW